MKDKYRGKAEELKGKITGNRVEQAKGKARQALGGAKQDAREVADRLTRPRPEKRP